MNNVFPDNFMLKDSILVTMKIDVILIVIFIKENLHSYFVPVILLNCIGDVITPYVSDYLRIIFVKCNNLRQDCVFLKLRCIVNWL